MPEVPAYLQVTITFTGAILYGMYLITLAFALRWLLWSDDGLRRKKHVNWPMLAATFMLFALGLVNIALDLKATLKAVIKEGEWKSAGITKTGAYSKPIWDAIVRCTFTNTSVLIADAVLIYRCWVVHTRNNWIIVFPSVLWLGTLACTILQAYWQAIQHAGEVPPQWQPVNMKLGPGEVLTPFWGMTAVLNAYASAMIVHRIWSVAKHPNGRPHVRLFRFAMRAVMESGILLFSVSIAHFVVWFTPNDYAILEVAAINLPVIGIAFNLILIRAAQNRVEEGEARQNRTVETVMRFTGPVLTSVVDIGTTPWTRSETSTTIEQGSDQGMKQSDVQKLV